MAPLHLAQGEGWGEGGGGIARIVPRRAAGDEGGVGAIRRLVTDDGRGGWIQSDLSIVEDVPSARAGHCCPFFIGFPEFQG